MPWRHVAVPSWCECGECCKTPKQDENVCCGVRPCRSTEFKNYLEKIFTEIVEETTSDVGELRRLCYQRASYFFHGNNWYPQNDCEDVRYTALPSCIVWIIRRHYEAPNGRYTGFPPKSKLLQKAFEARKTFRDGMNVYKTVVDVANPDGGLFTALQRLEAQEQLKAVYAIILPVVSATNTAAECEQRWTQSTNKGIEILPKLGFVACATAFEAFVHDTVRCCLNTVFSTKKSQ